VNTSTRSNLLWYSAGAGLLLVAVLVGASIGPAGPPAWKVPLELLDRLLSDGRLRGTVLGTQERAMASLRGLDFGSLLLERLAPVLEA